MHTAILPFLEDRDCKPFSACFFDGFPYSPEIPAAVAPTKNNVVKVMNTVLEDTEEQQKQNESVKDPHEKLIKFDIVNHIEF